MTAGGATAAFSAFGVAALVIILLMFALALTIALAQEQLVATMKAKTAEVKQWGGRILILVGIWLVILGIWANALTQIFPV